MADLCQLRPGFGPLRPSCVEASSPTFFKSSLKEGIENDKGRRIFRTFFVEPQRGSFDSRSPTHGVDQNPFEAGHESLRGSARRSSRCTQRTCFRSAGDSRTRRSQSSQETANRMGKRKHKTKWQVNRGRRTNYCNVRSESFGCASSTESISTKALNGGMESANQREGPTSSAV